MDARARRRYRFVERRANERMTDRLTNPPDDAFVLRRSVVIENRAASLSGAKRTLVVAIEDKQSDVASNRRNTSSSASFEHDNGKAWTERFHEPGQYVMARCACGAETRLPLARSPYHVRYDSSRLDSAKVEFLVDLKTHPNALTAAAPGFTFSVSAPSGGGFSNVLFAERSLESAMRKEHNLVIVAYGTNGMASVRSLLDWQPAMAYASQHAVTVFYLCESQEDAALLSLHDEWREEGFKIIACYGDLDDQIFLMEQCFATGAPGAGGRPVVLGADPSRASALLAGAEGETARRLLALIESRGVAKDNVLTSDFY